MAHLSCRLVVPEDTTMPARAAAMTGGRTHVYVGEVLHAALVISNPGYATSDAAPDFNAWRTRFDRLRLTPTIEPHLVGHIGTWMTVTMTSVSRTSMRRSPARRNQRNRTFCRLHWRP